MLKIVIGVIGLNVFFCKISEFGVILIKIVGWKKRLLFICLLVVVCVFFVRVFCICCWILLRFVCLMIGLIWVVLLKGLFSCKVVVFLVSNWINFLVILCWI